HERLDGSGYHRGSRGQALPAAVRLLSAADAYRAMTQRRAHRAALSPEEAAEQLATEVSAGRLDADAVNAVLAVAGHRRKPVRRLRAPSHIKPRRLQDRCQRFASSSSATTATSTSRPSTGRRRC